MTPLIVLVMVLPPCLIRHFSNLRYVFLPCVYYRESTVSVPRGKYSSFGREHSLPIRVIFSGDVSCHQRLLSNLANTTVYHHRCVRLFLLGRESQTSPDHFPLEVPSHDTIHVSQGFKFSSAPEYLRERFSAAEVSRYVTPSTASPHEMPQDAF